MHKKHPAYWISTGFLCLVFAVGGTANLLRAEMQKEIIATLGYPEYLMTLLGVAKILAVIAILVPGYGRLKEWAYAGLCFDMIGAAVSHLFVGDPLSTVVPPVVLLGIGAVSYLKRPPSRRI